MDPTPVGWRGLPADDLVQQLLAEFVVELDLSCPGPHLDYGGASALRLEGHGDVEGPFDSSNDPPFRALLIDLPHDPDVHVTEGEAPP